MGGLLALALARQLSPTGMAGPGAAGDALGLPRRPLRPGRALRAGRHVMAGMKGDAPRVPVDMLQAMFAAMSAQPDPGQVPPLRSHGPGQPGGRRPSSPWRTGSTTAWRSPRRPGSTACRLVRENLPGRGLWRIGGAHDPARGARPAPPSSPCRRATASCRRKVGRRPGRAPCRRPPCSSPAPAISAWSWAAGAGRPCGNRWPAGSPACDRADSFCTCEIVASGRYLRDTDQLDTGTPS